MSSSFVHLTASSTVNEVLARYPATAPIFHLLGLDSCCRAHSTLREAAAHAHTDLRDLLSMLQASASASLVGTEGG
jgi:iron-sulfur cluster repair protein YtfE (RIC family)